MNKFAVATKASTIWKGMKWKWLEAIICMLIFRFLGEVINGAEMQGSADIVENTNNSKFVKLTALEKVQALEKVLRSV